MIAFAHPWLFLLLIPALPALWYSVMKQRPAVCVPSVEPIRPGAVKKRFRHWKNLLPFFLYTTAMILLITALARPRFGLEEIRRRSEGVDIIIALDLSGSMAAIDVPRSVTSDTELEQGIMSGAIRNRIASAKTEIAKFIESRPNDRIGLIAFAPQPFAACPPTLDHAWLIATLDRLDAGVIGDSTNIAGPIAAAVRRLKDSVSRRRIIVLFTDGRDNVADKISPLQAAQLAAKFNITIYTVGIGSGNAVVKQTTPFGSQIFRIRDEFDEPLLKSIASASSGKYYKAADTEGMAAAMKEIDTLEKTTFEQKTLINWRELGFPLILAGLILLLAGFILENTVCLKTP